MHRFIFRIYFSKKCQSSTWKTHNKVLYNTIIIIIILAIVKNFNNSICEFGPNHLQFCKWKYFFPKNYENICILSCIGQFSISFKKHIPTVIYNLNLFELWFWLQKLKFWIMITPKTTFLKDNYTQDSI